MTLCIYFRESAELLRTLLVLSRWTWIPAPRAFRGRRSRDLGIGGRATEHFDDRAISSSSTVCTSKHYSKEHFVHLQRFHKAHGEVTIQRQSSTAFQKVHFLKRIKKKEKTTQHMMSKPACSISVNNDLCRCHHQGENKRGIKLQMIFFTFSFFFKATT